MATSITAESSDMPRSDSPNLQRMESVMCKAMDLEAEILADEQALVDVRAEIANAVAMLENPKRNTGAKQSLPECSFLGFPGG
jgi:hypothetical protein